MPTTRSSRAGERDQPRRRRDPRRVDLRDPERQPRQPAARVGAEHRDRHGEPDAAGDPGVVGGQRPARGMARDHERARVLVDARERQAHAGEHVAEHLRWRLDDRVLVARVDDGVALAGEVLEPRPVVARPVAAPAVEEQHHGQLPVDVGPDDRRRLRPAPDGLGQELRLRLAAAAARGEEDRDDERRRKPLHARNAAITSANRVTDRGPSASDNPTIAVCTPASASSR